MGSVRVAIVGVGNCATSLIQGIEYYRDADPQGNVPGLMHVQFGDYHVSDVEFVAAFDVDAKKVGFDLSESITASENNTIKFADVPPLGVTVQRGHTLDGLGKYYLETIEESDAPPVDVVQVLKDTKADVLVSYLPVGSELADKFYAQCAIDAGVAFVNALPVFITSDLPSAIRGTSPRPRCDWWSRHSPTTTPPWPPRSWTKSSRNRPTTPRRPYPPVSAWPSAYSTNGSADMNRPRPHSWRNGSASPRDTGKASVPHATSLPSPARGERSGRSARSSPARAAPKSSTAAPSRWPPRSRPGRSTVPRRFRNSLAPSSAEVTARDEAEPIVGVGPPFGVGFEEVIGPRCSDTVLLPPTGLAAGGQDGDVLLALGGTSGPSLFGGFVNGSDRLRGVGHAAGLQFGDTWVRGSGSSAASAATRHRDPHTTLPDFIPLATTITILRSPCCDRRWNPPREFWPHLGGDHAAGWGLRVVANSGPTLV